MATTHNEKAMLTLTRGELSVLIAALDEVTRPTLLEDVSHPRITELRKRLAFALESLPQPGGRR